MRTLILMFCSALLTMGCALGDDTGKLGDFTEDTEHNTGSDAGNDTGKTCDEMGFDCGLGYNDQGLALDCNSPGCPPEADICAENTCITCNTDDYCGPACTSCTDDTSGLNLCATDGSRCVECRTDEDCRPGGSSTNPAPLGRCTPDGTCTCWTPEANEKWSCSQASDCPDTSYQCARDFDGTGTNDNYTCLRECATATDMTEGLQCRETRNADDQSVFVWVPATTCFAFDKAGMDCSQNDDCRISSTLNDGACMNFDGADSCTYSCWIDASPNHAYCPGETGTCKDAPPNIGYCLP